MIFRVCLKEQHTYIMATLTPINEAAKVGDLALLMKLRQEGHEWTSNTMCYAAVGGHLECLRYIHEHGGQMTSYVIANAAAFDLECLKYLHENGCEWDRWTATNAAHFGHLECLKYLYEHGCPWDARATRCAAQYGHLNCLRYLHEHGCEWNDWATANAAADGHLNCLRYLHENGCEWTYNATKFAAEFGHFECLKYLHEHGCPWDERVTYYAARNGHFDCLQYLYKNGCPLELTDLLNCLNKHIDKLDFDQHVWLREFLFPHVDSEDMPEQLKDKCKAKIAQIALEKQAVETELIDKLSLDVVKHCLCLFI